MSTVSSLCTKTTTWTVAQRCAFSKMHWQSRKALQITTQVILEEHNYIMVCYLFRILLIGLGNPICPCYQLGVDLSPGNWIDRVPNVATPVQCQSLCAANQDCNYFSYATLGSGASYAGDCFLKSTDEDSRPNYKLISGRAKCPWKKCSWRTFKMDNF